MKKNQDLQDLAKLLRLLGDPTRLRLLEELVRARQNVSELGLGLRLRQPAVSHHLSLLRMSGLVKARREGKEVFYSVSRASLAPKARRLLTKLLRR